MVPVLNVETASSINQQSINYNITNSRYNNIGNENSIIDRNNDSQLSIQLVGVPMTIYNHRLPENDIYLLAHQELNTLYTNVFSGQVSIVNNIAANMNPNEWSGHSVSREWMPPGCPSYVLRDIPNEQQVHETNIY